MLFSIATTRASVGRFVAARKNSISYRWAIASVRGRVAFFVEIYLFLLQHV
jgi:hypothetical protein